MKINHIEITPVEGLYQGSIVTIFPRLITGKKYTFSSQDCKKLQTLNSHNFYHYNNEIVTPAGESSNVRLWVVNRQRLTQMIQ
jgi:hypothetical protein